METGEKSLLRVCDPGSELRLRRREREKKGGDNKWEEEKTNRKINKKNKNAVLKGTSREQVPDDVCALSSSPCVTPSRPDRRNTHTPIRRRRRRHRLPLPLPPRLPYPTALLFSCSQRKCGLADVEHIAKAFRINPPGSTDRGEGSKGKRKGAGGVCIGDGSPATATATTRLGVPEGLLAVLRVLVRGCVFQLPP